MVNRPRRITREPTKGATLCTHLVNLPIDKDMMKDFQAFFDGHRPSRTGFSIAFPTAYPSNNPGRPG